MTPQEAFEAWAKQHLQPTLESACYEFKQGWLAACAWQRERDAEIAKKPCVHAIGTCEDMAGCHEQIIAAIRQPEGR